MTEQDLTKRILRQAHQQAKTMVDAAEQHAAEQIATAETQATVRRTIALEKSQAGLAVQKVQQQRAHEVAHIKARINAQQTWIDRAFDVAREKLQHASNSEIQTIVKTYTEKYAKPGDQILIAENWAHALPELPTATINGGIIITNQTYRIELDLDSILAELRDAIAPTIAEILGVL